MYHERLNFIARVECTLDLHLQELSLLQKLVLNKISSVRFLLQRGKKSLLICTDIRRVKDAFIHRVDTTNCRNIERCQRPVLSGRNELPLWGIITCDKHNFQIMIQGINVRCLF